LATGPFSYTFLVAIACLMAVKHHIPGLRHVTIRLKLKPGEVWVRDWSDMAVIDEVWGERQYDVAALPSNASVIVDLGANIGMSAAFFSERYGNARVIALEPDPDVAELASQNLARFKLAEVRGVAVGCRSGVVRFYRTPGQSWGGSFFPKDWARNTAIDVPAVTLDSLIEELGHIDILKLDIEGAETEVLASALRLRDVGLILGEFHAVDETSEATMRKALAGRTLVDDNMAGGKGTFVALAPSGR
jgi:FkbM family methyltransferase